MRATRGSTGRLRALRGWLVAVALGTAIGLVPSPASAGAPKDDAGTTFLFGLSAGLLTLVYTPLKLVYATAAIPVSGLVWVWSVGDSEMAGRVMRSGTLGTFVVTPEHLRGEASLDFVGAAEEGPPEDERR